MKYIKLVLINIFILLLLFFTLFGLLNFLFGGVPQYNLFNLSEEEVLSQKRINLEKKNIFDPDKIYRDYFKNYYSDDYFKVYKEKGYTGFFKKELGVDINQIYQTDMFGNRENSDFYYSKVDVVLLGDSFLSVAINEPFDLTSNLRKLSNLTFLNLGKNGSGPSSQYQRLKYLTENTQFNTVFIFFYEGNDHQEINTIALETDLSIDHNINRNYFSNYDIRDFKIKQLDNLKKDVKIIAELNNFIFIDGDDALKGIGHLLDIYHYRYPTHFNSYGYRLMAEHILKILDE
jgi:hypothetical protein